MPSRDELTCSYYENSRCQSCHLLGRPGSERLRAKKQRLEAIVATHLGHSVPIRDLWQPPHVFPSRTKAKFSVSGTVNDPIIGLLDKNFRGTELLNCPLHPAELNHALTALKSFVSAAGLPPYDIAAQKGEIKGLMIKANLDASELLVRFVLRSKEGMFRIKKQLPDLLQTLPSVRVVSVNIQPLHAALLEGPEEIMLTPQRMLWEKFPECSLAYAPQSFSQVTPQTAQALYKAAASHIADQRIRSLLDLYCGVGGFSYFASRLLEWGHGVELSSAAIDCAMAAREINASPHLSFTSCDVEAFLSSYRGPHPDAVLLNPPRRGLSPAIKKSLLRLSPKHVLYSSCNPETLMRDLALLKERYDILELAPFDMFPLTEHIEVLALLIGK